MGEIKYFLLDFFATLQKSMPLLTLRLKKILFSTDFTHRKFTLWQSGGLYFQIFSAGIPAALVLYQLRFYESKPAVKP